MPEALIVLEHPIDVMYPIHKALRAEAMHAETLVRALVAGTSVQAFAQACTRWARALEYHAVMEDTYMTAPLDRPTARTNEAEHQQLVALLTDLHQALGPQETQEAMSARARRHLWGKVVTLRVAQDDHLEEEEERILPVIRQSMDEARQSTIAWHLLMDEKAQNPEWVLTWLTQHITSREQQLLTALTARIPVLQS
jgi:uncharacterized protein YigA (DUF484 family)